MKSGSPLLALLCVLLVPQSARAQGVSLQAGRLLDGDGLTSYQVAWTLPILGPFGADLGGVLWRGPGVSEKRLGVNADVSLFRGGRAGLYAVGGLGAASARAVQRGRGTVGRQGSATNCFQSRFFRLALKVAGEISSRAGVRVWSSDCALPRCSGVLVREQLEPPPRLSGATRRRRGPTTELRPKVLAS